jgi:serine/threonine-protein kinase
MQGRPSNHSGKNGRTAGAVVRAGPDPEVMRPGAALGKYELVVRLARGNSTEVWLAKRGDKGVAIKALRLDVPQTPELLRAFDREATIAGKLHHPNIVELLDAGRIGDRHYLAMEYVDGMSLGQLGRRRQEGGRLPLGLLAALMQQACLALHHAHELSDENGWLGFLHRDLCPDNILVSAAGAVKLIDFGAARMRSVLDGVGTRTLRTRYAAPERVQGLSEDRRSDVYSMGVILYEQATGTPPFQGSDLEVISQIVEGKPRDPRSVVQGFPEALARIVVRAMALHPGDRYPQCQALAADLGKFAAADGAAAATLETALRGLFDSPAPSEPPSEPPWEPQPMPGAVPQEAGSGSDSRERFAPDADFSTDDITRPSVVLMPDQSLVVTPPASKALEEVPAPAPAPAAPAGSTPAAPGWLSQRQQALSRAPADIFGPGRRSAAASFASEATEERQPFVAPRTGPSSPAPDVFSIFARSGGERPPPITVRAVPTPDPRPASPAAQRFDRGLELLGAKLYDQALGEWQEACRLDPQNRLYQSNLKRLKAQMAARAPGQTETE